MAPVPTGARHALHQFRETMSARGFLWVVSLSLLAWALVVGIVLCATRAFALDYELWAERPGALLSADQPNVKRTGQTFPSHHDCLEAVALSKAEKGWRLRCRPTEAAPVPRIVGR